MKLIIYFKQLKKQKEKIITDNETLKMLIFYPNFLGMFGRDARKQERDSIDYLSERNKKMRERSFFL